MILFSPGIASKYRHLETLAVVRAFRFRGGMTALQTKDLAAIRSFRRLG
jgi:hypothetical protein